MAMAQTSALRGFLVIDKPEGLSSQQAVARLRGALGRPKAGHTGTLDPLATGVLPIALGEATKAIPFLNESQKLYEVQGYLGRATTTYDAEGEVSLVGDAGAITPQILQEMTSTFLGPQEQTPPLYSAIKWQGKPLYEYARRGQAAVLRPRKVYIENIEVTDWSFPFFSLRVDCSRGTYIRSLVHDLGLRLGCFAHVTALRRLQSGPFLISQALTLHELLKNPSQVCVRLVRIEDALGDMPKLPLASRLDYQCLCRGVFLPEVYQTLKRQGQLHRSVAVLYEGEVVAFVRADESRFYYERVLPLSF